ncbi:MAG: YceI family protein [Alphaproteobacteria bacterium]|nr:YceI family protein [Alphaproteobacteria bacterium]
MAVIAMLLAGAMNPAVAEATKWNVKTAESKIGFSATHAGRAFDGEFKSWSADIRFDPSDLEGSQAVVLVDLASAFTGDQTYDKTLPTVDWFNTSKFAEGRFETTGFQAKGDNQFTAAGTLTMRGIAVPVSLDFTFEASGGTAQLQGRTTLKRLDYGIGKGSDSAGDWVALDIPVTVSVALEKAE